MTNLTLRLRIAVILLLTATTLGAIPTIDELRAKLGDKTTASDSLELMFDIYDLTRYDQRAPILEELYGTAQRSGVESAIAETLVLLAACHEENDSMQAVLLKRAQDMPESDVQKSTLLYIKVRNAAREIRSLPESERQKKMVQYMVDCQSNQNLSLYDRIEHLFYLCTYLRNAIDGDLLIRYIRDLQKLIDQLPSRHIYLRILFYNQASMSFLNNKLYDEAIDANNKMLDLHKELEKRHKNSGRKYPNYAGGIYRCYHNLLMCSEVLKPEEVDIYYNRMLEIIKHSPRLQEEKDLSIRSRIYYLMAKKHCKEAIPLIKGQLEKNKNNNEVYTQMVKALIEASKELGNKEDQLYGLDIYTHLLEERIETKAAERFKELQILYDVNDLKAQNDSLIYANREKTSERHRELLVIAVIGLVVLVIVIVVLVITNRHTKKLVRHINVSNKLLRKERDALKRAQNELIEARDKAKQSERFKSDFVNNMGHELLTPLSAIVEYSNLIADCIDDDRHRYIKRFADLVSLNSDLLLTLVNDVLELPSLENSKLTINHIPCSLKEICQISIDSTTKHLSPDVRFVFENESDNDTVIRTDPQRVEQVLIHLLTNAAKFTEKGMISFGYKFSDDRKAITFTISDTGTGIPKGKEDLIFSRFTKLDASTQGNGLGLYISSLLASLLKGDLSLDKDYRTGARFTFTIPVA